MIRFLLPAILLCGCVAAPKTSDFSSDLLCWAGMNTPLDSERDAIQAELVRRQYACTVADLETGKQRYAQWLEIRQAQQTQAANTRNALGTALFAIGAAAAIQQPPQQVHCTTQNIGGRAETICR